MNERILALDIGDARIGIAVSDASRLIASPVEVLHRKGWGPDVKRICELCRQYDTTQVLSGLPLNMDGSAGFQTEKVQKFCEQLEKAGLTVYYQDERLTTVTAERALLEDNMHRADRKQNVDKVAAAIILQQYLDASREAAPITAKEETPMQENNENIIDLIGEDGESFQFEHLATIEHEDGWYIVLAPMEDADADGDTEVIIMKIETDEQNEEYYEMVEDEDLQQIVFDKFLALMEEEDEEE